MLRVEDIHVYYGGSHVIQGVSLAMESGAAVSILGRNGVGKTTLIRSISGLLPIRRGRLLFKDEDITNLPSYKFIRKGIGLVPQGRRIFSSLTVKENLLIGAQSRGYNWTLERVVTLFPALKGRLFHRGDKLSGGEQQMLALGRCLMAEPDLLLMDEPSEGLAPIIVLELAKTIRELKENGHSIFLAEQNLPFAMRAADYMYLMSKGQIVYKSTPEKLSNEKEIKMQYLGVR